MALHGKRTHVRLGQRHVLSVCTIVRIQVARHTIVRSTVIAVRSDIHFNHIVIIQMEIVFRGQTNRRVGGQYHDTVVRTADAYLVLGTDHTQTLLTANLSAFDGHYFFAKV